MSEDNQLHLDFLRLSLAEAGKCIPKPGAFCVGCVLVARWPTYSSDPIVLTRGYSREIEGNTHAEANALEKLRQLPPSELNNIVPSLDPPSIAELLTHADVYTTMEPCSVRTSGLAPCADALIAAKVKRCFIGVGEPDDFVVCEGAKKLQDAGVEVIWLKGLEKECLEAARRGQENA
ncbi:hypothetical protein JAAARDRAFT_31948 [Jaapia argillacea MUCL 33604]|uniref:CMP/dCMP-type deaminase domain-containing protein n=1 Tax=Jaapia argillacea MUCL 33604 TaxID=933084 RepID=A0A067Q1N3_9AGAM|nr:hypothetical protein JAAARDRAFT_31948 [Jaapia argillacea MUCL 33604]